MENCIFCSIAEKNIPPHEIIWSDKNHVAFLDTTPSKEGHTLVIPKKHYAQIIDIPVSEYEQLFHAARTVSLLLKEKIQCSLVAMVAEGGSIPHAHVHLIPLKKGEKMAEFKNITTNRKELAVVAEKIRK